MKRPAIKFRAWINGNKRMVEWPELLKDFGIRTMVNFNSFLMQFTGFKDAKGKEVYEGDLLAWPDWHEHHDVEPMPVIFEYGGFWVDGSGLWDYAKYIKKGSNKHADPTYELEDLEVVGNIYQGDLR